MQTFNLAEDLYANERNSTTSDIRIIDEEQLCIGNEGNLSLILRLKNSTGNIINLTKPIDDISELDQTLALFPLSIDEAYKDSRHRTIYQATVMVLRWRMVSMGYFDYTIGRHVSPMTLD